MCKTSPHWLKTFSKSRPFTFKDIFSIKKKKTRNIHLFFKIIQVYSGTSLKFVRLVYKSH